MDEQEPIDTLLEWLSQSENTHWLMVFDSVDRDWQSVPKDLEAYDIESFLPAADHGCILITTRLSRLQKPKASLQLRSVGHRLGQEILETRAGKHLQEAERLLKKLGGLPLALVQAGAYLRQTNMTVSDYFKYYDETWTTLMGFQSQFPLQEYAERSVLTTWKMSYKQVDDVDPRATQLLDLWAFLYPGDVWYELAASSQQVATWSDTLERLPYIATDKLSFQHSLGILSQYSLMSGNIDGPGHSIHPVVHAWCLHNITAAEEKRQLFRHALRLVTQMVISRESSEPWDMVRRLIPHAKIVGSRYLDLANDEGVGDDLIRAANFLSDWESSVEVERLHQRALKEYKGLCGAEHNPSMLFVVISLGRLYASQEKVEQAEEMYQQALKGKETTSGLEHRSTLNTVEE